MVKLETRTDFGNMFKNLSQVMILSDFRKVRVRLKIFFFFYCTLCIFVIMFNSKLKT